MFGCVRTLIIARTKRIVSKSIVNTLLFKPKFGLKHPLSIINDNKARLLFVFVCQDGFTALANENALKSIIGVKQIEIWRNDANFSNQ